LLLISTLLFALFAQYAGQDQQSSGDAQKLLEQIESGLKEQPSNPRLLAARGLALERLNRDQDALQSLEKSLAISPKFLIALEGAAEITYRIHDPKVSNYLSRILQQDPQNAAAHGMAGALAFEEHDCAGADRHFASAESALSDNPLALAQWGECLLAEDQPHLAATRLEQSLRIRPTDKRVIYNLALALHLDHRDDQALQTAKPLGADGDVLNLIGSIYAGQDKIVEAIGAFRKATELDPKNEQNYIDLASLCLDHQSFDVAAEIVNVGISNIPNSAALYTLRGAIAAQSSNLEQSAADFERANRLKPDASYGDVGLSLLLGQQSQLDEAIGVIRSRLARAPNDATLNFLLADLLLRRSDDPQRTGQEEARRLLSNALHLQPDMAKAHAALGKLLLKDGDAEAAIRELKMALEKEPNDRVALNQYVLALTKLQRTAEARAAAEHLREVLAEDRRAEVQKNRIRIVNPSDATHSQ
jgi:tetratricopeptide (TPR) repeat protein